MDEIFNEKMVKKLPDTREAVLKGVIAVVSIAAMTASIMYAGVMCILVILAVGVGYYFLNKQFEIEYEYILTNDELDVDKNKVRVIVSMFGRETPVELELDQVETVSD